MNKERFANLKRDSLKLLILDAEKRILSSDDAKYIKEQTEFINGCEESLKDKTCPICKENEIYGDGRDALSRKTNEDICSECATKEAMEEYYGRG